MPDPTHCLYCFAALPPRTYIRGAARKFCSSKCSQRSRRTYHGGFITLPLGQRLWAQIQRGAPDDCWPFTGGTTKFGYGQISYENHPRMAHRLVYEQMKGEIPDGQIVRHTCDNPPCCNPAHLILGSHADNARDKVERDRAARLWDISTTKLTDDQVLDIVRRFKDGEGSAILASEFGVTPGYVRDLASGRASRAVLREAGVK